VWNKINCVHLYTILDGWNIWVGETGILDFASQKSLSLRHWIFYKLPSLQLTHIKSTSYFEEYEKSLGNIP